MWPFRKRPFLDPDTADWHVENFEWLIEAFGVNGPMLAGRFVLPDAATFPLDGLSGDALAGRVFDIVRTQAGMAEADWPVTLARDDNPLAARDAIGLEGGAPPTPPACSWSTATPSPSPTPPR